MSVQCISKVLDKSVHYGSELLMLVVLADYSDDQGNSYPGVASLARKCRMTSRNANYILAALQSSGELKVLKNEGPKGTNRYRIMLAQLGASPLKPTSPLKCASPLKPTSATPEAGFPKPLKPTSDEPSLNRQEPSGRQKSKIPACPFDIIQSLYNETLPELPKVLLMGDKRKKVIGEFWKWIFTEAKSDGMPRANTADQAIDWIRTYFTRARDNDFIMGRTVRSPEHANWSAGLDYLLSERGLMQIIEKTGAAS
jgi:hypothetical protein